MTGFLKLWIGGEGLSLDEVTDILEIQPTYSYKKGDTYYEKLTKETITYVEDCWLFNKEIETGQLEQEILSFIFLFINKTDYIKSLAKKFKIFLWLAVYPESEQDKVHLSQKVIETICKLGISINIEVADLREFYDGTYLSRDSNTEKENEDRMNFVDFRISGKNIDLENISKTLDIIPEYSYKKEGIHNEDFWIASIKIRNQDETEEKMLDFIDLFYKNKDYIMQILDMYNITLWITVCQNTNQYNVHFSKNMLDKISEMGIDIDVTCMRHLQD